MTNEQKDMIATYITAFKNFLARHILPDVAIRATVYPTSDQVLLVITLNRNNQGVRSSAMSAPRPKRLFRGPV